MSLRICGVALHRPISSNPPLLALPRHDQEKERSDREEQTQAWLGYGVRIARIADTVEVMVILGDRALVPGATALGVEGAGREDQARIASDT